MLSILLAPFELLIQLFYSLNLLITANHGLSLLLLSLEISLISLPLYILAEKWKSENEALQAKMDPVIDEIKEVYAGQKRYYLVQEVHRIFGYGGLNTLKVSFGLLIQIPFFFAAYNYLSAYSGYGGVSFLIFDDLSKADGLMGGIHLLPFLMTVVNLAGSFLYLKGRKRSDKLQLIIIALLFLVLLYDRPAALLLYWTMNNVLAVPKNQLLRRLYPPVPVKEEPLNWFKIPAEYRSLILAGAATALLILNAVFVDRLIRFSRYMLLANTMLAGVCFLILLVWQIKEKKGGFIKSASLWIGAACWLVYLPLIADWLIDGPVEKNFSTEPKRLILFILGSLITYHSLAPMLIPERDKLPGESSGDKRGVLASSALLIYALLLYSPLQTYSSAASELDMGLSSLMLTQGGLFAGITALLFVTYLILPKGSKQVFKQSILFLLGLFFVNYFVLRKDYGVLDGNILSGAVTLKNTSLLWYLFDGLLIMGLLFLSRRLRSGRGRQVSLVCSLVLIGLVGQNAFSLIQFSGPEEAGGNSVVQLPPESAPAHEFTSQGINTLLIVGDMFNGGLMETLLTENPDWEQELAGFRWYPDTLSVSQTTYTSVPAILGGWEYAPLALNEKPGKNRDKVLASYSPLFDAVAGEGAQIALLNPEIHDYAPKPSTIKTWNEDYMGVWNSTHKDDVYLPTSMNKKALMTMVGLFYGAPHFARTSVYSEGFWTIFPTKRVVDDIHRKVKTQWAYLDLLPRLSAVIDDSADRVKYMHNLLPHFPYGLDKEGRLITEEHNGLADLGYYGMEPATYSARVFIEELIEWFDWMKEQGVYDNTQIVVLSDHGITVSGRDPMEPTGLPAVIGEDTFAASHALLLFKPIGADGPFVIDPASMSNADAVSLLAPALDIPVSDKRPEARYYAVPQIGHRDFPHAVETPYQVYRVDGSIFDVHAWTVE